jgi:hypothetical protein
MHLCLPLIAGNACFYSRSSFFKQHRKLRKLISNSLALAVLFQRNAYSAVLNAWQSSQIRIFPVYAINVFKFKPLSQILNTGHQ